MKVFQSLNLSLENIEDIEKINNSDDVEDQAEEILSADNKSSINDEMRTVEEYISEFKKLEQYSSVAIESYSKLLSAESYTAEDVIIAYEALVVSSKLTKCDLGDYKLTVEDINNYTATAYNLTCEGFGSFLSYIINAITNILNKIWIWIKTIGERIGLLYRTYEGTLVNLRAEVNNLSSGTAAKQLPDNIAENLNRRLIHLNMGHNKSAYKAIVELLGQIDIGPYNQNTFGNAMLSGINSMLKDIADPSFNKSNYKSNMDVISTNMLNANKSTSLINPPKYAEVTLPPKGHIHILRNTGNKIEALIYNDGKFNFDSFYLNDREIGGRTVLYTLTKEEMLDIIKRITSEKFNVYTITSLSSKMLDNIRDIQKELKTIESKLDKGNAVKTTLVSDVFKVTKVIITLYSKYLFRHTLDCYSTTIYAIDHSLRTYKGQYKNLND